MKKDSERLPREERVPLSANSGGLLVWAAAWAGGIGLSVCGGAAWVWLCAALAIWLCAGLLIVAASCCPPNAELARCAARGLLMLGVLLLGGAWGAFRMHPGPMDIRWLATASSHLAAVRGVVDERPRDVDPRSTGGRFANFSFKKPATRIVLRIDEAMTREGWRPAGGRVLVRFDQHDHRLKMGDRIQAMGWLTRIRGPVNPGERDYAGMLAREGVYTRLTLRTRENWRLLDRPGETSRWTWLSPQGLMAFRAVVADRAIASLAIGMYEPSRLDPHEAARLSMLKALLLGRWEGGFGDLREAFRRVGLSHILSISGAHLAILLGMVWWVARGVMPHPRRAAIGVAMVLALFLLMVPLRIPIIRASLMAGLFCVGTASSRRLTGMDLLALAGLLVLFFWPHDLFSAGFQLSFGAVAALLLYANRVSHGLWRPPEITLRADRSRWRIARFSLDCVAVSVVASCVALPAVAYHFQIISPLATVLSVITLPCVSGVLAIGYLKIVLGLCLPSVSLCLSTPLAWAADGLIAMVRWGEAMPGAAITLVRPPSLWWVAAATGVAAAAFGGAFAGRKRTCVAVIGLLVAWLWMTQTAWYAAGLWPQSSALRLNMFAVGDGSCFLLRSGREAMLFDCGSQHFLDIGEASIAPALQALGVRELKWIVISHADFDHFCGVLDVVDRVGVGGVLVPPDLIAEAIQRPHGTAAFLLDGLRVAGVPVQAITAGWVATLGEARLQTLWPPETFASRRTNDRSLVLSVEAAGRRAVLNGDVQNAAIESMLASGMSLRADVVELAHHGSYVDASRRWLAAVSPEIALQSCGRSRLQHDPWRDALAEIGAVRYVTAEVGMVEVVVGRDGTLRASSFRQPERD